MADESHQPPVPLALLGIFSLLCLLPPETITAQEGQAFTNPFGGNAPRAETSARIAAWNPDTGVGYVAVHYVFPEGYHQNDDPEFFTIRPMKSPDIIFGSVIKGEPLNVDGIASYFDETTVLLEFSASVDTSAITLGIHALFQICDESGTCFLPDSEYHEISFNPAASSTIEADENVLSVLYRATDEKTSSLLLFLLMAFVGGILLNIMPCVLPLLSVKTIGLMKQAGSSRRAMLGHAWLYVAGIEVSFWILAAIVIALQASGKLLGWGFQFQSPAFVLVLTAIIWVFALSMFDVFVIEMPRKSMEGASAAGARGGYWGSFLTGVFAVLVATPCTAPFLGPALGFAFSQSPAVILAIFSLSGMGLGLPFLLLGIWPGFMKKLPKPGPWMNHFKEVMGFFLLGTTLYLFTTFMQLAPHAVNGALWWILALGFSAWLLGKARHPSARKWFRIVGQSMALTIVLTTGFSFIDLSEKSVSPIVSFEEADILERIDGGEAIFLEFTAQWCTTCKVNQRVLEDDEVQTLMAAKNIIHIKGDLTSYDETLTRWLAKFDRAGVPLYVLYRPGEEPYIFPELISVRLLVREFERVVL